MMNKSKAGTFFLSIIPGVGHMYLGLTTRGLQLMIGAFASIFFIPLFPLIFPFVLAVIWFYGMFDALQKVTIMNHYFIQQNQDDSNGYNKFLTPDDLKQLDGLVDPIESMYKDNVMNPLWIGQELSYSGKLITMASSQQKADQIIEAEWKVREVGDTLEMILELPEQFSLIDLSFTSSYLDVEIPQALITSARTKNNSIHAENMNADVNITSSNGKMTAESIHGNLAIKTSNGSITVSDIDGNVQANTTNGSVTLSDISGEIKAISSNGSMNVSSAIQGLWDISTSNGRITLKIPDKTDANIQASTSNGSFNGNITWSGNDKRNRSSRIGEGIHNVTLKTSNGNINVDMR